MSPQGRTQSLPQPLPTLILAVITLGTWAACLGWDQTRDAHPDGSTTGPYEAWQVIALVLVLLAPLYWTASRHQVASGVLGTTLGLTAAAFIDWSDDASGLFLIGTVMVALGSLAATTAVSTLIAVATRNRAHSTV
ncbi:hypothetical protein [Streptomyces sp. NPDC051561]|uniref:hypothetical protein n=1 Tax=Streptomyces sp. NPDC051561 TaxID=3365658 RepID=UPI0037A8B077